FIQTVVVRDGPDPRFYRATSAIARLDVALDLEATLRCLADEELDLVDRIAPRLAVDADLDDCRAEERVLPDGFDDLVRRIGVEVFGIDDVVVLGHLGCGPELPAHPADD